MTPEEYNAQEDEALEGFHPKLAIVLRMQAYDRGHSFGHATRHPAGPCL